jgi:ABC-2 type transport system ATP-binding protein
MTIVYTSHYMEEVQALCPRIGILDRGRLIACDDVRNLLNQLPGRIRLRVSQLPDSARRRLVGMRLSMPNEQTVEIECADVKQATLQVVSILAEERVEISGLETEEPNLEHVFLHLTGRALRD